MTEKGAWLKSLLSPIKRTNNIMLSKSIALDNIKKNKEAHL